MKKVLILAYDFPPYVSVGGLRPYSWYKYFHEFGTYPIVVTRQWGNKYGNHLDYIAPGESNEIIIKESEIGTIIRTPYKPNWANRIMLKYGENKYRFLRKAITAWYEFMQFLFFVGPKAGLYRGAKDYLKKHKVEAIIATGEPFVLFKYAAKLATQNEIPWIADYRDPWTQNQARSTNYLLKKWNAFFEKKSLKNASFITTVSIFLKKQIQQLIKNKCFHIIQNGYAEEFQQPTTMTQQTQHLTIGFAGTLYDWHPWQLFLEQYFTHALQNNNQCSINFYGVNKAAEIYNFIQKKYSAFAHQVHIHPRLSNQQLIKELAYNNILLLFNDYSILGTKIFDYLAVKRKILLCFSDDTNAKKLKADTYCITELHGESNQLQAEVIEATQSGIVVRNSAHLLESLTKLQSEFQEKGFIECHSINVEQYSRKKQTAKLAGILNNLIKIDKQLIKK